MTKGLVAFGLAGVCTIMSASAVVVFQDDFSIGSGSNWVGRSPLVGNDWWRGHGTSGGVSGGIADTKMGSTGNSSIWGTFTRALGPGETVILTYTTAVTAGSFGNGWSGIDLNSTTNPEHRIFTGAAWGDWGTEAVSSGNNKGTIYPSPRVPNSQVVAHIYFSYEYDTGNIEMRVTPQGGATSTITGSTMNWPGKGNINMDQVAFNSIRINVGGGADIALSQISVEIIPEPSAAALLGLGLLGLKRHRREA